MPTHHPVAADIQQHATPHTVVGEHLGQIGIHQSTVVSERQKLWVPRRFSLEAAVLSGIIRKPRTQRIVPYSFSSLADLRFRSILR